MEEILVYCECGEMLDKDCNGMPRCPICDPTSNCPCCSDGEGYGMMCDDDCDDDDCLLCNGECIDF